MLTEERFRSWLEDYRRVWEKRELEVIDTLYADDVRYFETPFDDPMEGREAVLAYSKQNAGAQRDIRFWHEPIAVTGDIGIARWGASFTRVPSGAKVELDGTFIIRFDDYGRCRELREWWHRRESQGD
jgi:hypothetical protein